MKFWGGHMAGSGGIACRPVQRTGFAESVRRSERSLTAPPNNHQPRMTTMRHPGTCNFYNGFMGRFGDPEPRRCDAGVCYEQEFGKHAVRAPCIEYTLKSKNGGTVLEPGEIGIRSPWGLPERPAPLPCSRRVEPTDDEVLQDAIEHEAYMANFYAAMAVVAKWRTWTKKNRVAKREVIECPVCKGRLHLSQAAYNGHVHGKCETAGCLSWME